MRVKDLPPETRLHLTLVEIPEKLRVIAKNSGYNESQGYIVYIQILLCI